MSKLFSPIRLGSLILENRIVIPPMCQYSAVDGKATDWHTIHLGHLALSAAGLLIVEATAVEAEGRISAGDLGLWNNKTEEALGEVVKVIKSHSPMPLGIQLAHAGRKASTAKSWEGGKGVPPECGGWTPVAPSAIAYNKDHNVPEALTQSRIDVIVGAFAAAAERADRIGFDVVEIHAAHGYLLHEFLSPLSNQRSDQYGVSLENRMRMVLDVFKAVRRVFPTEKAVGVRISATDWVEGGWDLEESVLLSQELEKLGCSYIHVSGGGLSEQQHIELSPNYQVPYAQRIKEHVKIPVIAVGLITEAEQAEAIVATGQADMVAIGRGILFDPRWPWHAAARLGARVTVPNQYLRSAPHGYKDLFNR